MGLLQELNIKPGVIYGDDVLKVSSARRAAPARQWPDVVVRGA